MDSISNSSLDKIFNDSAVVSQEEVKATDDEKYWSQKINMDIIVSDSDEKYSYMHFMKVFDVVLKEYAHDFNIMMKFQQQPGSTSAWNKYSFDINFNYRKELPPINVIKFIRSLIKLVPYREKAEMYQPAFGFFIIYSELPFNKGGYDSFMYNAVSELNNIEDPLFILSNSLIINKMNTIVNMFFPEKRQEGHNYGKEYLQKLSEYGSTR